MTPAGQELRSTAVAIGARAVRSRPVVRSMAAVAAGNATTAVLSAAGGLLIARFVAPETAGSFKAYTIPLTYLTFLHLGTFDALNRQLPLLFGRGQRDLAERAAAAAAGWNLALTVALSAGFVALSAWMLLDHDIQGAMGWAAQAIAVWGTFYAGYLGATYRTIHNFVGFARIQAVQAMLAFGLVFTLPGLGFAGLCLRLAFPVAVGTWLLHRFRPVRVAPSRSVRSALALMRVGLPYCAWGSINTAVWFAVESSLVLALGGAKGLGLWAVAAMIRDGVGIIPQAAHQVMTPRSLEAYSKSGRLGASLSDARRVAAWLIGAMVVVAVMSSYALAPLVTLLIPNYVDGIGLMKVALWSGVVQAATVPLGPLIGADSSWRVGRGILAGAIAFPITAFVVAPYVGGVMAVAVGSLVGKAVRAMIGYWELSRLERLEAA